MVVTSIVPWPPYRFCGDQVLELVKFSAAGAHLMEDPDSFTLPLISYRPDIEPTERLEDANFRDRALDLAIAEINEKTDLNIDRAKYRRVTGLVFAIKTQSDIEGSRVRYVKPKSVLPDCLTLWNR
jgi:plasmid replication initiation protein